MYCLNLVVFAFFLCVRSFEAEGTLTNHRQKRVIQGLPLRRSPWTPYAAVNYFVWISDGHECDVKSGIPKSKSGTLCPPSPNNLQCTGALLTSDIVQTACHCVSYFDYRANVNVKTTTLWAQVLNPAEYRLNCFVGNYTVDSLMYGSTPYRYYKHPKCRKNSDDLDLLYDYGLIVLNKGHLKAQHFAPKMTSEGLMTVYMELLRKQTVCLYIGFGTFRFKFANDVPESSIEDIQKSDVLRHGWKTSLDYLSCYWKIYNGSNHSYNYTEECSWFCTERFPHRHEFYEGRGDSGGPVTCDNIYAGIVSQIHSTTGSNRGVIGRAMSTAFYSEFNSIEYRKSFEKIRPPTTAAHVYRDLRPFKGLRKLTKSRIELKLTRSNSQPRTIYFSYAYLVFIGFSVSW